MSAPASAWTDAILGETSSVPRRSPDLPRTVRTAHAAYKRQDANIGSRPRGRRGAYTPQGVRTVAEGQANVAGTLDRLAEIASVHADAGADMLIPSGMLEGSVRALRAAVSAAGRPSFRSRR